MAAVPRIGRLSLVLLALGSLVTRIDATCFTPNGTDRNEEAGGTYYNACSSSTAVSMCCRTVGSGPDVCRSDGLCVNGNDLWRESCTDQTWKSSSCVQLCREGFYKAADGNTYDMNTTDVKITTCSDGSLCCGDQVEGPPCCAAGKGVWLVGGVVYSTKPSSTSTSLTTFAPSSTTITTTTAAATSSSSSSDGGGKDHAGLIAGSVVGGVLALAVIGAVLWYLTWRHKRNTNAYAAAAQAPPASDGDMGYGHGYAGATVYASKPEPVNEIGSSEVETQQLPTSRDGMEENGPEIGVMKRGSGPRHELP